jgi:hypothetical protein
MTGFENAVPKLDGLVMTAHFGLAKGIWKLGNIQ